ETIRSGWLTMGPKTVEFEGRFGDYISAGQAVALNSCTAALHLSLKAIDLGAGDEVIVPTNTFTSTGEVVTYFGARPVLVDVDRETHNLDIESMRQAITGRTKAIIPVHFAGQPCDLDEILEVAKDKKLFVIEDAAHSLPAWYKGRKIGTIGDITCFSFYATKTLSTGEGGAATTENAAWADRMRVLRLHGIAKDAWKRYTNEGSWCYEVTEAGYKYNMTDIQAALGLAQLNKVEWMWRRRKEIAGWYAEAFESIEAVTTPLVKPDRETAWHLYVIKLNLAALTIDRNRFIDELTACGIGTSVHFIPLHRHPYYRDTFDYRMEDFPNAEWIFKRCISLPIYPGMTDEEVDFVIDNTFELCKRWKR
ncbi:MAG: DegT/DnrJ/EryC1/StrS family aminotransferase, partial [bacterium]|nr:DegT/DnrJ/EryC1/StrS family aminotransferase [bacterium]